MERLTETLLTMLEYRDVYTRGHTDRGVFYALKIGESMGLSTKELEYIRIGGMIHDIGKVGIPDVILLKPGRLTEEEFEVMKLHVKLGYEMLKGAELPEEAVAVLLYHQEKYNGTGYPHGLKGEAIPLLARIYTVADAFEAMTARRIYKKAKSWTEAIEELENLASAHFDPDVVSYAIKTLTHINHVQINPSHVDQSVEKIRWSFQYLDSTGAIKGDLFLPALKAFMEQRDSFCLTVFDIRNLTKINLEKGWEAGNHALNLLVWAINLQCCAMYDIKDVILKLMKEDVIDITSPVIFRIGGDEFAVIAPYIPPKEKVLGVVETLRQSGIEVDYMQTSYPESFSIYKEALEKIFTFTKSKIIGHCSLVHDYP
ncbi:MAG: HD domain-containing protein [Aquificaceae bacterium]|nr:HD domain-containing protein [Aquificaceae bacterium]MCX8164626.1 HD domain-containing protein [Aquificaceae bacterium]